MSIALSFVVNITKAQISLTHPPIIDITNSNVFLDASKTFSSAAGAQNNIGKGLVIPSVDLVNFEFNTNFVSSTESPTFYDGMLVYNSATGTTLTTGLRSSTATAVTPGFYYFYNPNGVTNENITGGIWKSIGSSSAASDGDSVIGNEVAGIINDKGLQITGTGTVADPYKVGLINGSTIGELMTWDGNKWTTSKPNFWSSTGNSGTSEGTNFIGTTDYQDLVFKTDGVERARITKDYGNVGIGTNSPQSRLEVNGVSSNSITAGTVNYSGSEIGIRFDASNLASTTADILSYPYVTQYNVNICAYGTLKSNATYSFLIKNNGGAGKKPTFYAFGSGYTIHQSTVQNHDGIHWYLYTFLVFDKDVVVVQTPI